jgi:CPA2 family monovalent cation:H+ antiporter-2
MEHKLEILEILTIGLALASLLGYLAQRIHLPSMLGFLAAGYLIGPFSPGYSADLKLAEQLGEIGVILMLFAVGLHLKLEDLISVKNIAIPGAVGQTAAAAVFGTLLVYWSGWELKAGIIMGLAISVASTVVLIRILTDYQLLSSIQGHIAIGWLIVEDIFTIAVMILLPMMAAFFNGEAPSFAVVSGNILLMVGKLVLLAVIMFTWGHIVVEYILTAIARLRSHELLTLVVLSLTFLIAAGAAYLFGTSIALGAFIAGMIIGQTEVKHQAAANSLPLKDIFGVIFFLSMGMLFNPMAIVTYFWLFLGILAIILLIKPLTAFLMVKGLDYSFKIALTIAISLAQIGEFSFILAEQAMSLDLLPDEGFDILVACALVSISLNPIFFKLGTRYMKKRRVADKEHLKTPPRTSYPEAIIIGYGPIGQTVAHTLEKLNIIPSVIEQNIDTVPTVRDSKVHVLFGDASQIHLLEVAHAATAKLLVITVPEVATTVSIIHSVRHVNPEIKIIARIRYASEQSAMDEMHVQAICDEKEASKSFAKTVAGIVAKVYTV